jgi:hypothetical protein
MIKQTNTTITFPTMKRIITNTSLTTPTIKFIFFYIKIIITIFYPFPMQYLYLISRNNNRTTKPIINNNHKY